MAKICYVIMPYGGKDEKKKDHFRAIFENIITPAAMKVGYLPENIRRSDIHAEAGSIPREVINSLAEASVVVADLTEGNANVFYELGVRHVLRKGGTVHIIDKNHTIPFDLAQYRAIEYSTATLAEITPAIDAISKAIKAREEAPSRPDNPVHETLNGLPINPLEIEAEALQAQLIRVQEQAAQLVEERDSLKKQLEALGPAAVAEKALDIDAMLGEANQIYQISGERAMLRLNTKLEQQDTEGFIEELRTLLKGQFLSRGEYLQIGRLCRTAGLQQHGRVALEVARKNYPDDVDILVALADAYQSSPNPEHQTRGLQMIEQFLNVEHSDKGPRIVKRPEGNAFSAAITLYNYYLNIGRFSWVVSFSDSLEQFMGESNLAARNKARALQKMNEMERADQEFRRAITLAPRDDTTYRFYADYLDDLKDFAGAYEQYEHAITCDPDDGSLFMYLGNHIMFRGFLRNAEGKIVGPVSEAQRKRAILPLFIRALRNRYRNMQGEVIDALVSAKLIAEAQMLAQGQVPQPQPDWDYAPIEYVERLMSGDDAAALNGA